MLGNVKERHCATVAGAASKGIQRTSPLWVPDPEQDLHMHDVELMKLGSKQPVWMRARRQSIHLSSTPGASQVSVKYCPVVFTHGRHDAHRSQEQALHALPLSTVGLCALCFEQQHEQQTGTSVHRPTT